MATLHTQYSGDGKSPEGDGTVISPQAHLRKRGPCIQVSVSISSSIATQLLSKGLQLPKPVNGLALIDTGCSNTCVDEAAMSSLGIPPNDVVRVGTPSHESIEQNVYPIQIEFIGLPIKIDANRAIGAKIEAQGLLVLIGRDLLQNFTLFYNGQAGEITLSI